MEFRHFKYFVQIVDSRSLSAAAEALHVAQPALSQQIAQLEAELGVALLIRSARGVQPTPAGDALYRQAKSVLRQITAIPAIVSASDREAVGTVALGLTASMSAVLGLDLIARVVERLPGITLQISEFPSSYLAELLATARLEIAILFADPLPRGVSGDILFVEEVGLVSAPGLLAANRPLSLEQVGSLPLIVPARPNELRDQIDDVFRVGRVPVHYACEITGTALMTRAVRRGLGHAPLPWSAVHEELTAGILEMRDLEGVPLRRVGRLSCSSAVPMSSLASRVRTEIIALVGELVTSGRWPKVSLPSAGAAGPG